MTAGLDSLAAPGSRRLARRAAASGSAAGALRAVRRADPGRAPPPARPRRRASCMCACRAVLDPVRPRARPAAATTGSCPTGGCGSTASSSTTSRWEELRIPVDMAFFFHSSAGRARGGVLPEPDGRDRVAARARRVGRSWRRPTRCSASWSPTSRRCSSTARAARAQHWLVPIDECYALVGLIRTRWRGLHRRHARCGRRSAAFFDGLDQRARSRRPQRTTRTSRHDDGMKTGKPDVAAGRARRTCRGIKQGNAKGNYESRPGTSPTARSTAAALDGHQPEGARADRPADAEPVAGLDGA